MPAAAAKDDDKSAAVSLKPGPPSTVRTQPSVSVQIQDDDETVKNVESLKPDKNDSDAA